MKGGERVNSALRELYLNRMSGMLEMINNDRNLSDPLLMSVDDKYLQAHTKIMVVGQETNGWEYDPKRDSGDDPGWPIQLSCNDYVDLLMQRYQNTHWKKFFNASAYWRAADFLYEQLNDYAERPDIGYLWNNLDKVDYNRKKLPDTVRQMVHDRFLVLKEEVEITKPDVLVLFVGERYDQLLEKSGCKIVSLEKETGISQDILVRLQWPNVFPAESYILPHPRQLQSLGNWDSLAKVTSLIKSRNEKK